MNYIQSLKRNITLYYYIDFLVGLSFIVPIWVAFYLRYISFTELAILNALEFGLSILLELPTGALADMLGRKKTLILGYILMAISFIWIGFSNTFILFLIAYIIRSVGSAFISGSDVALLYDTFKELNNEDEYGHFAARGGFIHRMALVLGSFSGGYLYQINYHLPYLLVGVADCIAIFLLFFLIEPKIDTQKFSWNSYLQHTKQGFLELMKSSYTRKLSLYYILVGGITWSCLNYFNQPFAKDVGFNEIQMSWLFGTGYLISSLILLAVSRKSFFLSKKVVYIGLPLLMAIAFVPGVIANKFIAPLIIILILFSGSSRFTFLDKFTNEGFESKYRATAISSLNMFVGIVTAILIGASGKIQDLYDTKIIFTMFGIVSLAIIFPLAIRIVYKHSQSGV